MFEVIMGDVSAVLGYASAAVIAMWGSAHVVPTRQLVASFGPINADSRRIITQEWLAEGLAMWGVAAIVITATAASGAGDTQAWVYRVAAAFLIALGILTAATGARTPVVWFKICPVVMAAAAAMLLIASMT